MELESNNLKYESMDGLKMGTKNILN